MTQEQLILFKRSLNIYNTETEAWTALDNLTHIQGQPVVAFFRRNSNTHGDTALGAIFAIGTANGVGKYKACSSHDDMLAVLQALNTHISEWTAFKTIFDKMFTYDAANNAIKANLDFYTDSNKNISAGGLGSSGSSSLGALYQLVDVMINSTGDGVEGAVEGSVLAYDATDGKWKAIAQSEILPDMSGYYTKDETDAAINAIPIYSMAKLSASDIASLSDGANVREAYRLKKGGNNVDDTVIKIYKDSAIKSLELRDNKYLVLTYTDNEGNEQSISNDLSVIVNDNYVDVINNQEIGGIKTFTEKTIFKKDINVLGDGIFGGEVVAIAGDAEPVGVTNYAQLQGKPSINGKELASGDNTLEALGIQPKGDYATKAAVNVIQALIPATASADNQLADKDFVNSSIATATAEFRGSFTSLDELKATSGNLNDYAFYLHTDDVGNKVVDRYKWTTAGWLYEYTLNNSSFTAEQWAALNSAITATLVQSYNSHLKDTTIHITAAERSAWNNKWDYNEETIKAVKVNAAVLADKATNADTLDGYHYNRFLRQVTVANNAENDFNTFESMTLTGRGDPIAGASVVNSPWSGAGPAGGYGVLTYLWSEYGVQIANGYLDNHLYIRSKLYTANGVAWQSSWSKIALTTDNVASATKLQTARKIWGRPFDGSSDVSGDLTEVGNITASGKATIQGDIISGGEVAAIVGEGTPAGVTDYSALTGKPSINGVTLLSGNNTLASLGIQAAGDYATNSGVATLLADYATKTFISNNYAGKAAFNSHTADTDIHITAAERNAWNAKWDYNEATIKAVKVTSASSADSVAWTGISGKPTTFTPSAHTHTASDISGLPTNLSAFTNDVGYITGITKSMVEGVLTGNITSHTHTFDSLTSKPTTIAGYGITDAYTVSTIDSKLSGYLSLSGGVMTGTIIVDDYTAFGPSGGNFYLGTPKYPLLLRSSGTTTINGDTLIHSSNFNSYAPKLDGTGASGTWGINISGNAATATNADTLDGYHETGFYRAAKNGIPSGDLATLEAGSYYTSDNLGDINPLPQTYSSLSVLGKSYYSQQLCVTYNATKAWLRGIINSTTITVSDWHELAFTDSNVASATKLQTPRTIWGKSFDGTSDVNGDAHITGDLIVDGEVSALVS